jgi:hypothetical protein
MFALKTSFKLLLLGGGGVKTPLVEVTVNKKEESSEDFCSMQLRPRIRPLVLNFSGLFCFGAAYLRTKMCNTVHGSYSESFIRIVC